MSNTSSCWMQHMQHVIHNIPLHMLSIPGTHDSGTYAIDKNSPLAPHFANYVQSLVLPWSKTQTQNFSEQLALGIRYLDLRICHVKEQNNFFLVHGLLCGTVQDALQQVAKFVQQNVQEVVILDMNHFYCMNSDALHAELVQQVVDMFQHLLVPFAMGTSATMGQIWQAKQQVIVIYHEHDRVPAKYKHLMWSKSHIRSPWANTDSVTTLKSKLRHLVKNRPIDRFFVTQAIVTPNGKTIAGSVLNPVFGKANNLQQLVKRLNDSDILIHLSSSSEVHDNIIIVDMLDAKLAAQVMYFAMQKNVQKGFEYNKVNTLQLSPFSFSYQQLPKQQGTYGFCNHWLQYHHGWIMYIHHQVALKIPLLYTLHPVNASNNTAVHSRPMLFRCASHGTCIYWQYQHAPSFAISWIALQNESFELVKKPPKESDLTHLHCIEAQKLRTKAHKSIKLFHLYKCKLPENFQSIPLQDWHKMEHQYQITVPIATPHATFHSNALVISKTDSQIILQCEKPSDTFLYLVS